jgi:hypothetical protein
LGIHRQEIPGMAKKDEILAAMHEMTAEQLK